MWITEQTVIARTAWLFGPHKMNFVERILQLANERDRLTIVDDQVGSPTFTLDLAVMLEALLVNDCSGIYHVTNAGKASWYDLAARAVMLKEVECPVEPIPSSAYKQLAQRPSFSVLNIDKFTQATGMMPQTWDTALEQYLANASF